jgi:site-specific DNA recombinase
LGFSGAIAREAIVACIVNKLYTLPCFDEQFRELVEKAHEGGNAEFQNRRQKLHRDEATLAAQRQNLGEAMRELGPTDFVKEQMAVLELRTRELTTERRLLEAIQLRTLALPKSLLELKDLFQKELIELGSNSFRCAELLRRLVPRFHVYYVRLCDGGNLLSRAKVTLTLDGLMSDLEHIPGVGELLQFDATLDLFKPTQRERIRAQTIQLAGQNLGPKAIAALIPERPTSTAVQNALALEREMRRLGLTCPYVRVLEPPADLTKFRRHKNHKYRFSPVEGYQRPTL